MYSVYAYVKFMTWLVVDFIHIIMHHIGIY